MGLFIKVAQATRAITVVANGATHAQCATGDIAIFIGNAGPLTNATFSQVANKIRRLAHTAAKRPGVAPATGNVRAITATPRGSAYTFGDVTNATAVTETLVGVMWGIAAHPKARRSMQLINSVEKALHYWKRVYAVKSTKPAT